MAKNSKGGSEKSDAWVNETSENDSFAVSAPAINLPKGGGAIRDMGEKFAANPVTGTGSMSVPIATSPGRSGFGPQLSLSYDSGAGNGPFGLGWNLSVPSITRKTDKGLPKYQDGDESDTYILSGAEDLVPVLKQQHHDWIPEDVPNRTIGTYTYRIKRYRPRIEGLFVRIERWTNTTDPGDVHWRSISKDNILTLYGKDENSRIFDHEDPRRIFSWLICETRDDKGNAVLYKYKSEDGEGVDLSRANERNRGAMDDPRRSTNRYLKRIYYGNRLSLLDGEGKRPCFLTDAQINNAGWMFEVVFDYGEHDQDAPKPDDAGKWDFRKDPFSIYRAGFEVRTTRICQRVLMFHHFDGEEGIGNDCLVRSTDFTYSFEQDPTSACNPVYTFLNEVTQSGYKRNESGYLKRSLPPVEFQYTQPMVQDRVEEVDAASLENLPMGVDGSVYQWTDLHGEGLPGILTEQDGGWFYKRNLSPINDDKQVELAPIERVTVKPNMTIAGGARFMDLAGDGLPDLVILDGPSPGLYEHDEVESWQPFRSFTSRLNRDLRDPNLKFVDLNGDGHADVFITEDDAFVWHASLAEEGFSPAQRVVQALDEEKGPRLVFADGTEYVYLADLSGDGLTDLARIRNGEVCYWPNLGYGRFGAKVTMDHAPLFDHSDQFDHQRLRLADIDGTGTTDIIYLHRDGVRLYFNQSGNGWSDSQSLNVFPRVDDVVNIAPADLLGNGTACLVWSSPLPGDTHRPMRYVNLMGQHKPHLLVRTINNLGAETRVQYASSIKFYLQDKRDGKPWITRLPFPVHVVERVETHDHISHNCFVTRYAYHHGYFDGEEREFRGFGMVEQWDTEEYAALTQSHDLPTGDNIEESSHVPPVLSRTWFHTGAYLDRDRISMGLAAEYYGAPSPEDPEFADFVNTHLLPDTLLPKGLTLEEKREACRGLKGAMLRQEVYALDGTDKEAHPYTVTEQNFTVRCLQPKEDNRHGVFFTHAREAITYHYERNPADPRIQHALTLEVDDFGNVRKSLALGYGRQPGLSPLPGEDRDKQEQLLITYTENDVTNAIDDSLKHDDGSIKYANDYRIPLPAETRTYELTGFVPENGAQRFSFEEWTRDDFGLLASAMEIPYRATPDAEVKQKRLIEQVRTRYRRDDLTGPLSFGEVEPLALPFESYKLAFTPGLVTEVYGERVTDALLEENGRYVHSEGDSNWWISSGRVFFSPGEGDSADQERDHAQQHFFLPYRFRDSFEQTTTLVYDQDPDRNEYNLLVTRSRDPLGNEVNVDNDYRVLRPQLITDPNGNRYKVAFDALGLVAGTAVMGKAGHNEEEGDSLDGFQPDLASDQIDDFFDSNDPHDLAPSLLGDATTRIIYDLDRFLRSRAADPDEPTQWEPVFAATLTRETHVNDPLPPGGLKIQINFSYSDGFGREIQQKIQAEPGPLDLNDPDSPHSDSRWLGSGWTIFNNKGKPVRQYEPFFCDTHRFQFAKIVGVSPILFYDPAERVVATLHPNHTWEKVVFDPWRQETWDVNDTVLVSDPGGDPDVGDFFCRLDESDYLPTWYDRMIDGTPQEQDAAEKSAEHAGTSTIAHFDTLGRPFLTIADNGTDENGVPQQYETRVVLDIEGNQREIIDPRANTVMQYDYDMLSNKLRQNSMDAGQRWTFGNIAGNPVKQWDERNHAFTVTYDALQRPCEQRIEGGDGNLDHIYEKINYGDWKDMSADDRNESINKNLIGKPKEQYDTAGRVVFELYDFKGNLKQTTRRLLLDYKNTPNWTDGDSEALLEQETFATEMAYDALNRVIQSKTPDGSITMPSYNDAGLLEKIVVTQDEETKPFVKNVDYNEKGQRTCILYGNDVQTSYEYDWETFRLIHLKTHRADNALLQDLYYTYDAVGNITRIEDKNIPIRFFNNEKIEGISKYRYDPLYQLIEAQGREHRGQLAFGDHDNWNDLPFLKNYRPGDDLAWRNYTQSYAYDGAGNITKMKHLANGGSWTRNYEYSETNNRLIKTTVGADNSVFDYTHYRHHPQHGFMTGMPHLQVMEWNFKEELSAVARQRREDGGTPETTYYVYDAEGQRVRKVTENTAGPGDTPTKKCERIYVDGIEIYRDYTGNHPGLERKTLHIMDDTSRFAMIETRNEVNDGSPEKLVRYQLGNHLGSATLETDDSVAARVISYEEFHPYGTTAYQAMNEDIKAAGKRYRYTGRSGMRRAGLTIMEQGIMRLGWGGG